MSILVIKEPGNLRESNMKVFSRSIERTNDGKSAAK